MKTVFTEKENPRIFRLIIERQFDPEFNDESSAEKEAINLAQLLRTTVYVAEVKAKISIDPITMDSTEEVFRIERQIS